MRWFISQYGHRPALAIEDKKIVAEIIAGDLARDRINRCREYDRKFDAAYKSWIARESCPGR